MDSDARRAQHKAMVNLIAAESEFLRSMGWVPLDAVVEVPGAPAMWKSPDSETYQQDHAIPLAKMRWVQRYER